MTGSSLGFIITRKVVSKLTNEYWKACYKSIRTHYKENMVVIIDDHSDYSFIDDFPVHNTIFINSTLHAGIGELLAYYYFHTYHFFEKAVIIHDSVFIQHYIDFNSVEHIRFLFDFEHQYCADNKEVIYSLISLSDKKELLKNFYDNGNWVGCFGIMSVISYNFLDKVVKSYNFINMIMGVTEREERCAMERIFALCCFLEYPNLYNSPSFFGNIHSYIKWGLTFEEYIKNNEQFIHYPIIKAWTGR